MRRIIVTGGTGGIGSAIVRRFAQNGDKTAIIYRSNDKAAQKLTSDFENVFAIKADISSPDSAKTGVERAISLLGGADVLVNNAGIAEAKLVGDVSSEDFDRIVGVDLKGAFFCCQSVISEFLKTHSGRIINISSMWGEVGASMEVHYSAAKAGVIGLTKALAKELGPSGITVNCVSPGVIDTEMNSCYDPETMRALADDTPLGRIGTPEDVAGAVFFLASSDASFITGQIIGVNGGYVI